MYSLISDHPFSRAFSPSVASTPFYPCYPSKPHCPSGRHSSDTGKANTGATLPGPTSRTRRGSVPLGYSPCQAQDIDGSRGASWSYLKRNILHGSARDWEIYRLQETSILYLLGRRITLLKMACLHGEGLITAFVVHLLAGLRVMDLLGIIVQGGRRFVYTGSLRQWQLGRVMREMSFYLEP